MNNIESMKPVEIVLSYEEYEQLRNYKLFVDSWNIKYVVCPICGHFHPIGKKCKIDGTE